MDFEKYTNPKKVYKNFVKFGYKKDGSELKQSTRKGKKWMIYDPFLKKWVHFGAMFYEDYTVHNDKHRRDKFWSRISLRCGNDPVFLDPEKDPYDLIKIHAIKAGGFSIVAKSLKDAKQKNPTPKFYLDTIEETITTRTEYSKLRNKALVALENMYSKNNTKLMYVAKCVDIDSTQYTKNTPVDIIYENMDLYINGDGTESNKKRAAETFIRVAKFSMEDLKITALVKDCMFYRFITKKGGGWIETLDSGVKLGKRQEEVVEFLKKPDNEETLNSLLAKIEPYWTS